MKRASVEQIRVPEGGSGSVTILEWHVREGESLQADQPVVDLLSRDGLTTLVAETAGRVSEILVDDGAEADPGQTIALILS